MSSRLCLPDASRCIVIGSPFGWEGTGEAAGRLGLCFGLSREGRYDRLAYRPRVAPRAAFQFSDSNKDKKGIDVQKGNARL